MHSIQKHSQVALQFIMSCGGYYKNLDMRRTELEPHFTESLESCRGAILPQVY